MDKPVSPVHRRIWKHAAVLLLMAAAVLYWGMNTNRLPPQVDPLPESLHDLFPYPEEPFNPDLPLPPEPSHADDPAARERFALFTADCYNPFVDPYDQIAIFDKVIEECGSSPDRNVRAGVGGVMMLKAGRVLDRRQLAPLYDEIIMRARSMPQPHGDIADVWARTGKALLQLERKNRQLALDQLLAKERSPEDPVLSKLLLRAKVARIEEADKYLERIELCTALVAEIAQKHDMSDSGVREALKKTLRIRLRGELDIAQIAAVYDETLSTSSGDTSTAFKCVILDAASQTFSSSESRQEKERLGEYVVERFGADADPEVKKAYLAALRQLSQSPLSARERIGIFGNLIAFAATKELTAAIPALGAERAKAVAVSISTVFLPGITELPAGRGGIPNKEVMDALNRLAGADTLDDPGQARAEYDAMIRLFQDNTDERIRIIAVRAYCARIGLAPEPRERLALCDQAIAAFGGDEKVRGANCYSGLGASSGSILSLRSELTEDDSPYRRHYERVAAESADKRTAAKAMLEKIRYLSDDTEKEAIYDTILELFQESYRPDDQRMVVECLKRKAAQYFDFEKQKPFLYHIRDAYYHSSDYWLRYEANLALRNLIWSSSRSFNPPPDQKDTAEINRLRIMLIDDSKDDGDLAAILSYLTLADEGTKEGKLLRSWIVANIEENRSTLYKLFSYRTLFDKTREERDGLEFYDAVIRDYRAGNNQVRWVHVVVAYQGKMALADSPQEKLRIWNEYLEEELPCHGISDRIKKAELMESAGQDSLPVYEDIISQNRGLRQDRIAPETVQALDAKYRLVDGKEEKLAILNEIIAICRSRDNENGGGYCFGPQHKAAIIRKSELLNDESIKKAYFEEVVDWFQPPCDQKAEGMVINSLNELAEMAGGQEEKTRLYKRMIGTLTQRIWGNSIAEKQVWGAYRKLIAFAPAREEKIQVYEDFFRHVGQLSFLSWEFDEDQKQYQALLDEAAVPAENTRRKTR